MIRAKLLRKFAILLEASIFAATDFAPARRSHKFCAAV